MSFAIEKLKSVSKKIYQLIDFDGNNEQEQMHLILDKCTSYFKRNQTYFSYFSPSELLKITIYVYSLKRSSNFFEGDKILQNLRFVKLFQTELEHPIEVCEDCSGDGYVSCETCDGNGTIECRQCDGDGSVECEYCAGSGADYEGKSCDDCQGFGQVDCDWCGGEGTTDCGDCDGGSSSCPNCDGDGEKEDEENYSFEINFVMSWDSNFNNICEIRENDSIPISNSDDWSQFNCIFLSQMEGKEKINTDLIEPGLYYCVYFTDEPKDLKFDFTTETFTVPTSEYDIKHYL